MSERTMALLDRVTRIYKGTEEHPSLEAIDWLRISREVTGLNFEEAIEAFEGLMKLALATQALRLSKTAKGEPDPLNECLRKLQHMMAVGFWAKIIEIEFSAENDTASRLKVTEFISGVPQYSRSAIKHSLIDAQEFPIADFASACLQQPAPDLFF